MLVADGDDVEEALRTSALPAKVARAVRKEVSGCSSLHGRRVHVENEAATIAHGAMMDGGWRFAKALAGHRALLASIVTIVGGQKGGVSLCRGKNRFNLHELASWHAAVDVI